jgi:hypothetical protein
MRPLRSPVAPARAAAVGRARTGTRRRSSGRGCVQQPGNSSLTSAARDAIASPSLNTWTRSGAAVMGRPRYPNRPDRSRVDHGPGPRIASTPDHWGQQLCLGDMGSREGRPRRPGRSVGRLRPQDGSAHAIGHDLERKVPITRPPASSGKQFARPDPTPEWATEGQTAHVAKGLMYLTGRPNPRAADLTPSPTPPPHARLGLVHRRVQIGYLPSTRLASLGPRRRAVLAPPDRRHLTHIACDQDRPCP